MTITHDKKSLPIVKYPHHALTRPCIPVDLKTQKGDAHYLIEDLFKSLMAVEWGKPVGLAANQIADHLRIFIALGEAYINPEIIWRSKGGEIDSKEGCYSLEDGKFYNKMRAYGIKLKYQDINGNFHEKRFNGFNACVIQHEMDHLDGKLCNQ